MPQPENGASRGVRRQHSLPEERLMQAAPRQLRGVPTMQLVHDLRREIRS